MKKMKRNKTWRYIGNAGSSLVMALVVVTFIAVLGMTIISMALSSSKVKSMESKTKNAYYNADMAVDEIYAGLAADAYAQLAVSYDYVVSNLLEVDGDAITMIDNSQANRLLRNTYFKNTCYSVFKDSFLIVESGIIENSINSALNYGGEISNIDLTKFADNLKNYMSATYRNGTSDCTVDVVVSSAPQIIILDGTIKSITIKDVTVTYQNIKTDYFSQVTTDYEIVFPEKSEINIVEDNSNLLLSFRDYAFVSNAMVNSSTGTEVNGGVYGYSGINCVGNDAAIDPVRLSVKGGNLVTCGSVELSNHAGLTVENGRIWADNIELIGADLVLQSSASAYVADDLTLTPGTMNNSVTINGDYYGYSIEGYGVTAGEATPAKSSAIIVNSRNSKIDFTNIKTLVLGGYGWVIYDEGTADVGDEKYYRTGESIAIKYAQTAYILPESWNGIVNANFFGKNLLASEQVIENDLGDDRKEYFYNFSSGDNAAKFYRALYNDKLYNELCADAGITDAEALTEAHQIRSMIRMAVDTAYSEFLVGSSISINENARVYEKGIIRDNASSVNEYNGVGDELVKVLYANSVWRQKIVGSLLIELGNDWMYDASEWTPVTAHGPINYGSMRFSYKIKSEDELNKGAVDNILLGKDKITGNCFYYVEDESGNNANDYMVYVSAGDVEINDSFPCKKGIIIAKGAVNAKADFEGCIIATGNINIINGNYTARPELIETIMKNLPGVRGYFDGTSDVSVGMHTGYNDGAHTTSGDDTESGDLNRYQASDCVNIANYRRSAMIGATEETSSAEETNSSEETSVSE